MLGVKAVEACKRRKTMLTRELLMNMYRTMVHIRAFEERVFKEFTAGNIPGFVHLYTGEEAVAAGACANLKPDDYIASTHRGHGHLIAKGGRTNRMMAELFGKKTGYNQGKGGSMHIADVSLGILGANGVVGAGIPIATGAALSAKLRKTDQVAIAFFGDGATNTGRFHEGVNLAACLSLPVIYIVENNMYAISVPISYSCRLANMADRAAAYGIPGVTVDGNDAIAVYEAVSKAVSRARRGEGPTIIECKTFRWRGHWAGDSQGYVGKEEVNRWLEKDPVARLRNKLIEMGQMTEQNAHDIDREAEEEIDAAVAFARQSPYPSPEETLDGVYAEAPHLLLPSEERATTKDTKEVTYLQAINEATSEELARDPAVFILGQDLRALGAPRGEFRGLFDRFGPERVIDAPISETAILGSAIGAAATGLRPIVNIMYASFLGVCGDELINQLSQMRYMLGGQLKLPVTVVGYSGGGFSGAAQHSKTLYGLLMSIPGLKLVVPATPYDAKGLLKTAIRDDNPVIFLYHQLLLRRGVKGEIPVAEYAIPLGKADIKREGSDVTVVAIGLMVERALAAADRLEERGISIEIIDPRTLVPLDKQAIIDSVRKTHRLVIMDEEPSTASAASEIASTIGMEAFDFLGAPIVKVCAPDTPIPFSPVLEQRWMPDEDRLVRTVIETV
jgi:2-oxoisovalerate dehydrogenase E1 component